MNGHRKLPSSPQFVIPDLDVPPANPGQSQSAMRAVIPPESRSTPKTEVAPARALPVAELDDALTSGPALALDLDGPISNSVSPAYLGNSSALGQGFELESLPAAAVGKITVIPEARANWPSGTTPLRERLVLDPVDLRGLANYGAPFSIGALNVIYAVRVIVRKRALKQQLRAVEKELRRTERRRDQLLADFADGLRPEVEKSGGFRRLLEPLRELDALAQERGGLLSEARQAEATELAKIQAELGSAPADLQALRARLAADSALLESKQQAVLRLEARLKRIAIEIRGLEEQGASPKPITAGPASSGLAAQLQPLQAQAQALAPELSLARAAREAAQSTCDAWVAQIRKLEARVAESDRQRRAVADRYRRQADTRQKGMSELETRRQSALADLGRAILAARTVTNVDVATLARISAADTDVLSLLKKSELHLRALDACDSEKVSSGVSWLFALLAAIAGYLVYLGVR